MAESVNHRFSEYLRNNAQANEEMGTSNAMYDVSHEAVKLGKTIDDPERYRSQERRSSITSFSDLYERAVRNLLNIRPLFDSPMDIFGPKGSETSTQFSPQNQTRQYKPERAPPPEGRELENGNSEPQNYRYPRTATTTFQSEHFLRGHESSSNGFFAQVLSEHARFSHNRQNHSFTPQRRMYGFSHVDRVHQSNGQVGSNNPTGHVGANNNTGYNQTAFKGGTSGKDISHERYWQQSHRHKPSMFDDLRYHAKLVLSGELAAPESETKDKARSPTGNENASYKQEVLEDGSSHSEKGGANVDGGGGKSKDTKLSEKEQLDLIRERIIKENQKLKYRPYSLRSKRNNLKKGKAQTKKNKLKRKPKIVNLWKPSTPQEVFLYQFGLMKNLKLDVKKELVV